MESEEYLELKREWLKLQEDKDRLEALVHHLEGEGGKIYDSAPKRGLFIKKSPCPPEYHSYQKKNSNAILQDYKNSLKIIEEKLKNIDTKLKKLVNKEDSIS